MNDIHSQLDFIYAAGETRRFHTWPVLRQQNVAAHSWHVAMLGFLLYGQDEPGITPMFMMALLTHDMAECRSGDIPSPAKRRIDTMLELADTSTSFRQQWNAMEQEIAAQYGFDWEKFLTSEEVRRFKIVDNMEGALYCINERMMGNKLIAECFNNYAKYISELILPEENATEITSRERNVFFYIKAKWETANAS